MSGALPEIIFFGRLEERKGLVEFLDALTSLAGKGATGFSITFLGKEVTLYSSRTGRVRSGEYIRRQLDGWGLPYQILPDFSSQEAIAHVRQSRSAVVCLASPTDNFPNAGLEMAQIPVPLVLSDTIAFRQTQELVGRREGLFWFKPESVESLCTQLGKALESLPAEIDVPGREAVQAINKSLAEQRLRLIEKSFPSQRPFWPLATTRVCVLSNGEAGPIKASLRSLQCASGAIAELVVWSPEELPPGIAAEVKSVAPHITFTQEIAFPPPVGGRELLLLVSAGVKLQPSCLENFVEAASRSNAGLVASAEWYGMQGKEVRTFTAGSVSQLLQMNRSSGACILLSREFHESLPAPTADSPHLMIWQLTLAAAITGQKAAYIPFPQYLAPQAGETDREKAICEKNLALLSRYAAGIRPGLWTRRELFGMALSVQQLAESLQRTRESLVRSEQQTSQTKGELALAHESLIRSEQQTFQTKEELALANESLVRSEHFCTEATEELRRIKNSGPWRVLAWLRHPRRKLQTLFERTKITMKSFLNSKRWNASLEPREIFPSLEDEVGACKHLLKGRVLNAGAGNRDLSPLVDGELTNQDIAQGLHNSDIHIYSPLHQIPREDGYFDVIFCNAVLEHVENPEEVVEEFSRVCREGGLLYLVIPFLQPEHKDPTDFQRYTADGLAGLVTRHGFAVEKVEPLHNIYVTLSWIVTTWLSQEQSPRNLVLKGVLYPVLRYLCRHSKDQVFAAASAYRIIARRVGCRATS